MSDVTATPRPDAPRLAGEGRRLIELFGVCGLAIARPVYDGFGAEPAQFLLRDAHRWAIVAFALLVAIVPPIVVWGVGYVVGFSSRAVRKWAHWTSIGSLLALLAVELTGLGQRVSGWSLVACILVVGMLIGRLLSPRPNAALWLRYVGLAAPVFCLQFLLLSAASGLVLPRGDAAAAGEATGPTPAADHVVMVVLDELPTASLLDDQDRVDPVRFPNFARLTETATFYRNHTTVADNTIDSLPALLTGTMPEPGPAAPAAVDHPDNLFSMLAPTYDVEAIETVTRMCPSSVCEATSDQSMAVRNLIYDAVEFFDRQLRREPQGFSVAPRGDSPRQEVDAFVSSFPSADDPAGFRFLHVLTPHNPWETVSDGRHYDAPTMVDEDFDDDDRWRDEYVASRFRTRHLQKLEYADELIGRILDGLEERGIWDDTLLVVMADHGIGFSAGQRPRPVSPANEPEVIWTPLWMKLPDQPAGEIVDDPIESVDVVPMIGAGAGIEVPYPVDGKLPGDGDSSERDRSYVLLDETVALAEEGYEAMLALPPASVDDGEFGVWRTGPELTRTVGEPAADFATRPVEPDTWKVVLAEPARFDAVDPDAGSLPLSVQGAVRWGGPSEAKADARSDLAPGDLAVLIVNRRVAGWSALAPAGGDALRFAVIIPPPLLVDGPNDIEVGIAPDGTALDALRDGTAEITLLPPD